MKEVIETPDILFLTALNAVETESGDALVSPRLPGLVIEYDGYRSNMWEAFEQAPAGSLEEVALGRKLADYYMIKSANELQNGIRDNKVLWARRFNEYGSEFHGDIDEAEAKKLLQITRDELYLLDPEAPIISFYDGILQAQEANTDKSETVEIDDTELRNEMHEVLYDMFPEIFETIEVLSEGEFTPVQVRSVFGQIVQKLAKKNPEWANWTITNDPEKTMLSVVPTSKEIDIPDRRRPVSSKAELLSLALHEIGVHATRSVNGYSSDDELMAKGLPNYIDFEEGLGILFEYVLEGRLSSKTYDRYIDIALAQGVIGGTKMERTPLFYSALQRELLRNNVSAQPIDERQIIKEVSTHIRRIFRGGSGNMYHSQDGQDSELAVYRKDMVYYGGFLDARQYIRDEVASGKSIKRILRYLLQGKFDPNDQAHVQYVG